ncbi:MAG: aminoacyl-histidine dipeptidase [Saprospiraceae bacterium]|nr:aminoacyl-histidine dipeptidase [Saprospiraceae bacterium]
MAEEIRDLEPSPLWTYFSELNAVPRPSKKEERVIAFIRSFGESLGLDTRVDAAGNVLIRKPASPGREGRPTVVLQSHLDMVHQKNAGTAFDFDAEGIRMRLSGDWVEADGTTLGADNGIGVAAMMAVLAAEDLAHPPLEALFTIDEETGMTGAMALEGGVLTGRYLLNLDTENDRELTIGCAGGVDVTATGQYPVVRLPEGMSGFRLGVSGLTGGHSGMDIHLGRGNANKLMNRLLAEATHKSGLRIASLDGGSLRNAIPRESFALIALPDSQEASFRKWLAAQAAVLEAEYRTTDPGLRISLDPVSLPERVMSEEFQADFLRALYACPNGIGRMSPDIEGLVQTSNNLARVEVRDGAFTVMCLTRSAVESEKMDMAQAIRSVFELIGADVTFEGSYPGWEPRPDSSLVVLMRQLYKELYDEEPLVNACHAGLECGILGRNYPKMEMISFGPNIHGAHSPDEKVQVSSVRKFWQYLRETLARI